MKNRLSCFRRSLLLCLILCSLIISNSFCQTFPANFSRVSVATALSNPTAMAIAPDGRIFITEQGGKLIVIKNGTKLVTPAITLTVDKNGERGLLGIALDPSFSTNNFVYLYYTIPAGAERTAAFNRISRFTFSGDVIAPATQLNLLSLNDLSSATNHNGGSLNFGTDGKLYIAVGDNASGANAQNLDNYLGKLLRINKDGSIPAGNPFSGSEARSRIWAYGLRNPFTINVEQSSGKIYVNDVGQNSWEEINDATIGGKNFGWPSAEGNCSSCTSTNPIYFYGHVGDNSTDGKGCAITGGAFVKGSGSNYPDQYKGKYFFIDYCGDWINYIDPASPATRNPFATLVAGGCVSLITGIDGNLYYLSRDNGTLYNITFSGSAPAITTQPVDITVSQGQSVQFSVAASGTPVLTYQWRKNGTDIQGATSSVYNISAATTANAGQYSVVVTNSISSVVSRNATLVVIGPNTPPIASINSPAVNATYRGGDYIYYSGSATDQEDATIPASAFNWNVIFHHDTHTHPGPDAVDGVKSGYFQIDRLGETSANVWYELVLTVADSKGAAASSSVSIYPITSTLFFNTVPAGLQLKLEDQPIGPPFSIKSVSGTIMKIEAVTPQTMNNTTYIFDRWVQGGPSIQNITVKSYNSAYIAYYKVAPQAAAVNIEEQRTISNMGVNTLATTDTRDGETGKSVLFYPNPVNDQLIVRLSSYWQKSGKIIIKDALGKLVTSQKAKVMENILDMERLPSGLYFLHIVSGRETVVYKILKNK